MNKVFADLLPGILKPIAKTVAVFIAAFIVRGLAWLIETTGVEVPYDPTAIETAIGAVLLAAVAWATQNLPKPDST